MTTAIAAPPMTTAELLALPEDDSVERWLIDGELREKAVTKRNRFHCRVTTRVAHLLEAWLEQQPQPRGEVFTGEIGMILAHDPDTTVGIDVAYVSAEVLAGQAGDTTMIDGVPVLAVEILSPSDTIDEIREKADTYLAHGVPHVWQINPYSMTVTVLRPGTRAKAYSVGDDLTAEPHMPGFRVAVAALFG